MTCHLEQHVLVLNRLWQAVNICSARRALTLLFEGRAQVVLDSGDGSFQTFNFSQWHDFSQQAPHPESIHTVSFRIRVPRVILLALFDRMTTGEGQYIDVSIHDACSIGTEAAVPEWMYNGATLHRQTGMHAAVRRQPDLELPTADGMYVIAVNQSFGDRGWAQLVEWMEEKGVAGELTDPKYRDEAVRMADYRQGTAVRDGIRRLIAACKGEELFHRAQSYGISWGLVRAPEENYDVPHYGERGFWRDVEHPEIGRAVPYPRGPFMAEGLDIAPRGRAPHLGEHTRLVLTSDLGLPAAQIDALAAAGVIR